MTRDPARIGTLEFIYADPAVNVTTEQRTVEHETIDDSIVIQTMGRKPDQLSIEGVVQDIELDIIDDLTTLGVIELRSERWQGDVVVKSTSTDFKRAKTDTGNWLYDVSIECIEVDERTIFDDLVEKGLLSESAGEYLEDRDPDDVIVP